MNEKTDVVSNLFYKLTPIAATHAQQNRARRLRPALQHVHAAQEPVSTQAATRTPLQERTAAGLPWPPSPKRCAWAPCLRRHSHCVFNLIH